MKALLADHPAHRFVLYSHEGLPTGQIPSARNALRVSLPEGPGGAGRLRSTIQRVLDRNPDGLDWVVLLDPFDRAYGGPPPESPLNGLKVASVIADLAPTRVDDRRLAPLQGHDAILAYSESTAAECRRRLPAASRRIKSLGLALDDSWAGLDASEPLGRSAAETLGRMGIEGPYLLANLASGAARCNLGGILEAYHRLPLEHQKGHQLVIAGEVEDPWAAVAYLLDRGCAEGLVLAGAVDESTLRTLYARCAAFVSPGFAEASSLPLVEAMRSGAAVVAGRAGSQGEILCGAGLLADSSDPSDIADQVARLLADVDLRRDLREKALARSGHFTWGPVVEEFLCILHNAEPSPPGPRYRFDQAHVPRTRIAIFGASPLGRSPGDHLDGQVARACRPSFDVDLYFEPGDVALVERFAIDFGGFDARQFARNDDILDYHAVVHVLPDVFSLKSKHQRIEERPGLVILRDESSLDRIGLEDFSSGPERSDIEAEVACQRLRELFLTLSRLGIRSPRNLEAIQAAFPGFADRVVAIPALGVGGEPVGDWPSLIEECAAELPGRPLGNAEDRWRERSTTPHSALAELDADDSYLEAR